MTPAPLACNPYAMTPEQRQRYSLLRAQLKSAVRGVRALEHGYALVLEDDANLPEVAEFVSFERLCCPFLSFALRLGPGSGPRLELTGPEGTPEFLHLEFDFIGAAR